MPTSVFKNDDAGYVAWRNGNPQGFVLNVPLPNARDEREYYLGHVVLHRADCSALAPDTNGEKPWTSAKFFKVCGNRPAELEDWMIAHATVPAGWSVRSCKVCGGS